MSFIHKQISDAQIQVFKHPIVQVPGGFCGGLVLKGPTDAPLRHTRGHKPVDSFRPDEKYEHKLSGEYFYMGPVANHFGHFMAEMVHRIMFYKNLGMDLKYVMVMSEGPNGISNYNKLPGFTKEILNFLEIDESRIVILDRNTLVETLHVCEAGSDLSGGVKGGYLKLLREYSTKKLEKLHGSTTRPAKIYVSRSGLPPEGSILGEDYFERHLADEGFTIFRPEEMRFTPQMDYYQKSEVAIFTDGSACHGTELLGDGMLNQVVLIPRRGGLPAKTFEKVLKPRSRIFHMAADCMEFIGTPFVLANGRPAIHRGASLIDIDEIVHFFRSNEIAALPNISVGEYRAAAELDFKKFLAARQRSRRAWSDSLHEEMLTAFERRKSGDGEPTI